MIIRFSDFRKPPLDTVYTGDVLLIAVLVPNRNFVQYKSPKPCEDHEDPMEYM